MISLTSPLPWYWRIDGKYYRVNLAFDNVLRFYDLLDDKGKSTGQQAVIAWHMFVNANDVGPAGRMKAVEEISDYISKTPYHEPKDVDPTQDHKEPPKPPNDEHYYSYTQDAPAIWSSILAQYGVDLDDQMGKLHWYKFQALLAGLSPDSYFNRIISIRQRSRAGLEGEELANLVQAQEYYMLDEYRTVQHQNQQMLDVMNAWASMAKK